MFRVHRTSASQWCKKHGIPTFWQDAKGGKAEFVHLSDLPEDVRLAYVRRECEAAGLVLGTYDEAEHAAFATKPPKMRAAAERKAEIARFMHGAKPADDPSEAYEGRRCRSRGNLGYRRGEVG